ncbi:hypothetical protein PF010_g5701 [Phytophthora fragariae]|uniref:Protein kinase domain-containing protein n=1 Tax=Phytophthora fragariae TaxID=53985 RepID=A0A6A3FCH0_9STRA|nr:hypothetical protein PF009_g6759 [Phytophthora fragariae]KAE9125249.1 hypothetical protein PF010_g5701 [Phytophthora fragariae]KAE9150288.1 hypothetical protein PF006_g5330 [Phytophthora fragariae]KAE9245753.1 hypothetical protein PF004_g5118 [Phytophthora fragariae]KAE9246036.1 hypothetical protein PF002_g6943 [Phytophthora fragariae]
MHMLIPLAHTQSKRVHALQAPPQPNVPREAPPGRMKVRQLLGWTRPTDMANSNNKHHGEDEDAPFQDDMGKLSIDDLATPEPSAPRAGNNNCTKEMEASHLAASTHSSKHDDGPEEPEDKASTIFSPTRSAAEKGATWPRTPRTGSDGSSNSSTASSSRSPSGTTIPSSMSAGVDIASPTASSIPKVTFRKGEKSFLDFHQHYAITRHLGEGSYSTVKQVTHRKKGGFYACKIVDKLSLSDVDRAALSHEVRVLSSVSHVNIMRLYEVIEDDAKCYLVTELAEGGDLFDRIVKQGKFPEREAQKVTAALVEALHYCHTHSIIHRDVKPENVLLSGDDVKLCDFGFARQLNHQEEQASDSCGTPGYAAPEILDGRSYGLEVDVFSLGVVTYIMLCGYPPFPMKLAQLRTHRFNVRYPSKDWAAIHPDVKTLISKMLHVDPKERPSMAVLRCHPWIQAGRITLERLRRENEERRRLADLTRRQQAASAIRKKLVMGGFEAVKYGRNGLPHRTKLRLSTDGKVLSWQPKLLKRSLLRYQNARSFTSLFGIGGKENNGTSQPDLHAAQPEANKFPAGGVAARVAALPTLLTRSVCGGARYVESGTGSTPSSPVTPPAAKMLRMRSPSATLEQPTTPSATSPDRLDDSIKLHDIREMLAGDTAPFFAGHAMNLPNSSKRAVDPACVLSVCTRFRELHLEFPYEGVRDGFMYLLQQATLPLQQSGKHQPPRLMKSTSVPPPAPHKLSGRLQDTFVATTPPDEESKMQIDEQTVMIQPEADNPHREHSSRPEVDDEDVKTVAKEATAASSNNQDE